MIKCINCGAGNPGKLNFCTLCGTKLPKKRLRTTVIIGSIVAIIVIIVAVILITNANSSNSEYYYEETQAKKTDVEVDTTYMYNCSGRVAEVYDEPKQYAKVVFRLEKKEKVMVMERRNGYVHCMNSKGQDGWIMERFMGYNNPN